MATLRPPGLLRIRDLPFWGLLCIFALIPFDDAVGLQLSLPHGTRSVVWLLGLAVGVSWVFELLVTGRRIRFAVAPVLIMSAWLLVGSVSALEAVSHGRAVAALVGIVEFILLFLLIGNIVTDRRHVQRLMAAFVLGALGVSLLMLSGASAEFERSGRATIAQGVNPNTLGFILANSSLLGLYLISSARNRVLRSVTIVATAVILLGLAATGSVTAVIGFATSIVAAAYFLFRRRFFRTLRMVMIPAATILVVLIVAVESKVIPNRALQRTTFGLLASSSDGPLIPRSAYSRLEIWYVGVNELMWWKPLTGIGPGQFAVVFGTGAERVGIGKKAPDAHSIYLQTLVEYGIIGLLLVLALFGTTLRQLLRWAPTPLAVLAIAIVVCAMVMGLTHTVFNNEAFWLLFGLVLAIASVLRRENWPRPDAHGRIRPAEAASAVGIPKGATAGN